MFLPVSKKDCCERRWRHDLRGTSGMVCVDFCSSAWAVVDCGILEKAELFRKLIVYRYSVLDSEAPLEHRFI